MTCGIYEIVNTKTKHRYVGQSTRIEERWMEHGLLLNRGKHPHCKLQDAWMLHGPTCFKFVILETLCVTAAASLLYERERFWIHRHGNKLYNDERPLTARPGYVSVGNVAEAAAWPFTVPIFKPRRTHLGPPNGEERRKVMYSGRRDHLRLAEIINACAGKKRG
jgi:hypothetical protein